MSRASNTLDIRRRSIGAPHPCYVIAEIGNNHQGSVRMLAELIRAAAGAGADAVKLQRRTLDRVMTESMANRPYQGPDSFGRTYGEHRRAVELDKDGWRLARDLTAQLGIALIGTPFDPPAVDDLMQFGVDALKVASGDVDNGELLDAVAGTGVPSLVSTGGATMEIVQWAVAHFPVTRPALLHCVSIYPTPPELSNVRAVTTLQRAFPHHVVGYSSHDQTQLPVFGAVALGAAVVERHFTLHKSMRGTDHIMSSVPAELGQLIDEIAVVQTSLGDGVKAPVQAEGPALDKMRKSLVPIVDLGPHTRLRREHLEARSPGNGISPRHLDAVVGLTTSRALQKHEPFCWEDLRE